MLDGRTATAVRAVGKQMFLEFDDDLWLRVHLGMYGAWDFAGEILVDPTIASANGRMGQTNQRGTVLDGPTPMPILSTPRARTRSPRSAPRGARACACRSRERPGSPTRATTGRRPSRRPGAAAAADRRDVRRPARSDRVRAADARRGGGDDREARSRPARRRRRRGRGAVHRGRAPQADADRPAAHGPDRRQRHRQRLPRRAALPRPAEPAHARSRGARRGRARPLARLGAAARDRRRDRSDDDDGRPRPRGVPRGDGEPRRPPLGVPPRRPAVPGLRHRDRGRGGRRRASCTGARTARREHPPAHPRLSSGVHGRADGSVETPPKLRDAQNPSFAIASEAASADRRESRG